MDIFGFEITRKKNELRSEIKSKATSFVPPVDDDGTPIIQTQPGGFITGGAYGAYIDMEGGIKNEAELIRRYRETSLIPECDSAIEDIINECITSDSADRIVTLDLRDVKLSDSIKKKIQDEFSHILSLMKFNQNSHEIFRKWYVDGRIYFHKVVDSKRPKLGLIDLRAVDPLKIKKVRNVEKDRDNKTGVERVVKVEEFYVFNDKGFDKSGASDGATVKIAPEAVTYTTSGLLDYTKNVVIGYLHKALKTANQLSMMEDALVIYRISRAPERRIFYIDVGNLPKAKAEQYLADVMHKYKNKLVYNADTGEIKDDRKHMSMLEDFWLPRREGGRGTEITTLPGGMNLGDIDDIEYFKKKLYQSLSVPSSRMEADNGFNMGRASEINRDELKFNKFTNRLQKKFARVFTDILRTQLILKEIVTGDEFDNGFKDNVLFDFATDNHFTELKEAEILRERLDTLSQVSDYIGKYFSHEYIRKYVLRQTEEDIKSIDAQIKDEGADEEGGENDENGFGGF
ncbi:uncharacterized protein METZ01_LOCUS205339 [marine metagenome]|uniref:Portal protein n=1 Tax=marine metagenome TaxID=408172 RepID=A0A382EQ35_9ZZZZ